MRRLLVIATLAALAPAACAERTPAPPRTARAGHSHVMAVILDADGRFAGAVRGNGTISDAIGDGARGWFVEGSFTRIDGAPRPGLARIDPAGVVDPGWRPRPLSSAPTLGAASTTAVYLTNHIDDSDTYRLIVLDARTGRMLASRVLPGFGDPMAADADRLYVANVLPITSCVGALDRLATRIVSRFALHMLPEVTCVNDLALAGGKLYAAGSLGIDSTSSASVARFDSTTGRLDRTWRAQPVPCRTCYGLAYSIALAPGRVFVNPGAGNADVSALSADSGAIVRSWRAPGLTGFASPVTLAVAGHRLFVTEGQPNDGALRAGNGLATFDIRTGATLPSWHPARGERALKPAPSADRILVPIAKHA